MTSVSKLLRGACAAGAVQSEVSQASGRGTPYLAIKPSLRRKHCAECGSNVQQKLPLGDQSVMKASSGVHLAAPLSVTGRPLAAAECAAAAAAGQRLVMALHHCSNKVQSYPSSVARLATQWSVVCGRLCKPLLVTSRASVGPAVIKL